MLRAVPNGWFSRDFIVVDGNTIIATIKLASVTVARRESGQLDVGGSPYTVYREGWLGAFVLERERQILARADKPSVFRRSFEIRYGRKHYVLSKRLFWRTFVLREDGRAVGSLTPEHAFTRKMLVDLPEDIPLAVRVFMVWLTVVMWNRASS